MQCYRCSLVKAPSEFYVFKNPKAAQWCKDCWSDHNKRMWKARQERKATRPRPDRCEACGETPYRNLDFDHCHQSGKFRGWLCPLCNRALGQARDSVDRLKALTKYLETYGIPS